MVAQDNVGAESAAPVQVQVGVMAVNDAPTLLSGSTLAYTENDAATAINTVLTLADVDNTSLSSATVSITTNFAVGQDVLAFTIVPATMGNIGGSYNAGDGVMTLTSAGATATLAQWESALRAVTYAHSSENPSTAARTVSYAVNDGTDNSNIITSTVNVTAINDAPTASNLSAAQSYTEDTPLNLIDIVITDPDSLVTATLTLSNVTAGALSTATSGAVTSTYNAGTGVWSASGAVASVNTLLAGVLFNPALNFNGNFSLATSVSDGAAPAVTGSKAFTGIPVNDAPSASNLSAAQSYTEDTPLNLIDIVTADVDSASLTVTLALSNT